jgi:hypothetical protein
MGKQMAFNYVQQNNDIQQNIMRLADNMAAAAASFNSHGYDMFINAREEFKEFVNNNIGIKDSENYFTVK